MKNLKIYLLVITLLFSKINQGQLSFTISSSLCEGDITNVTANTGTLTALQYSWGALPSGPLFSTPTASSTNISFISTGTFNVALGILTGSGFVYATNTIVIYSLPILTFATTSNSVCAGFTSTLTGFGSSTYTWTGTTFSAPVYQQSVAVGPGSYTVSGTNSAGCISSTSVNVGLYTGFSIQVSQSSATTCLVNNQPAFSKPVLLTASGAGVYEWFPYNPWTPTHTLLVNPASTTCYTVVGTSAVCSATAVSCVTVIPQFTISILPSTLTMCLGETHSLQVGNVGSSAVGPVSAWSYSWTEASNSPPISISSYFSSTVNIFPQNSTSYTLEMRDSRECVSLPTMAMVTVNPCTGIIKVNDQDFLVSYPNPVKSHLIIRSDLSSAFVVCIDNMLGEKFIEVDVNMDASEETSIDLTTIPPGVYFLKLSRSTKLAFIRKIIKE